MPDAGARQSKKLDQEQVQNELDKVSRISEEIALDHQLQEEDALPEQQRLSGGRTGRQGVQTETNLEAGEDQSDELRHTDEQIVQQDLNQGMDTGTHDSTRHGVNWGKSYQTPANGRSPLKKG